MKKRYPGCNQISVKLWLIQRCGLVTFFVHNVIYIEIARIVICHQSVAAGFLKYMRNNRTNVAELFSGETTIGGQVTRIRIKRDRLVDR